jgi:hypothetical protein
MTISIDKSIEQEQKDAANTTIRQSKYKINKSYRRSDKFMDRRAKTQRTQSGKEIAWYSYTAIPVDDEHGCIRKYRSHNYWNNNINNNNCNSCISY